MISHITRIQQVSKWVAGNRLLSQVYAVETEHLEQIVDLALNCEYSDERWQYYERLKGMANRVVGWNASHDELRTNAHYEVMMIFIDWLLPEGGVE